MVRAKTLGLVGAGKFVDSPLSRMLLAGGLLGPVKAPSLRVASRIANTLRTGYPVSDYQHFEQCRLILISVPDDSAGSTIAELSAYPLTWTMKTVVLCSSALDCAELSPLAAQGAQIGALSAIPGFEERWLLLEAKKPVETQIGKFLGVSSRCLTVIRPPLKPFYLAALACAGPMLTPMLIAAGDALQKAGISRVQASAIIERQVGMSARAYLRAGRKVRRGFGHITDVSQRLASTDAELAGYLNDSIKAARWVVGRR